MFKDKKSTQTSKSLEGGMPSFNQIASGTSVEGDVNSTGDIRVDGTVKGSISTKGKLVVGKSGKVEGEINCNNADVSGEIKGNIVINELLQLKSTAKLFGDIVTNKLAIEPGANFSGTCSMGAVVKGMNHAGQESFKETKKLA